MNDSSPTQTETPPQTQVWETTADCTQFILAWSQKIHVKREPTIFDVIRDEFIRRAGLRRYGVKMRAKPRVSGKSLTGRTSSVVSATATGQAIVPHQPKLLSNERAA